MDCMRLFTKEDVLDGDEKPVSHPLVKGITDFHRTCLGKVQLRSYWLGPLTSSTSSF
jgi:hypothetical protein